MAWCHAGAAGSWDREPALIAQARLFTNHVTLDKSLPPSQHGNGDYGTSAQGHGTDCEGP